MKILILISLSFILFSCNPEVKNNYSSNNDVINVKYSEKPVNISKYETIDTSISSWIESASYDENNQYLILNLKGINYKYCGVPLEIWESFKEANSFGKNFNSNIKGKFDCRK